ncbi:MAG: hypothetical protein PHF86_12825 [Candidatus Nanoarchaeia archaeon]|nr:hypothetical protein [Candidatus Nanoarchaeia archaeon]
MVECNKTLKDFVLNERLWVPNNTNPFDGLLFVDLYRGPHSKVQPIYEVITDQEQLRRIKSVLDEKGIPENQSFLIKYFKGYPIPIRGVILLDGKSNYLSHPQATSEQIKTIEDFSKSEYWQNELKNGKTKYNYSF